MIGPPRLICLPQDNPSIRHKYVSDPASAFRELAAAAENGDGDAAAAIGNMYLNRSIDCNDHAAKALEWSELGIEQGSTYAYWVKGWTMIEQGTPAEGVDYFRHALQQEFPPAALDLGVAYEMGWGVRKDYDKSRSYYEYAKRLGHASAGWALTNLNVTGHFGKIRATISRVVRPLSRLLWRFKVVFGPNFAPTTVSYFASENVRMAK